MKLVCAEKSQVEEKLLNQNGDSLSCKLENAESVKGSIEGNHVICCVEGLAEDTQVRIAQQCAASTALSHLHPTN